MKEDIKPFTLSELLVVIGVLAFFIVVFFPTVRSVHERDKKEMNIDGNEKVWTALMSCSQDGVETPPELASANWEGAYAKLNAMPVFLVYDGYKGWLTGDTEGGDLLIACGKDKPDALWSGPSIRHAVCLSYVHAADRGRASLAGGSSPIVIRAKDIGDWLR